MKSIIKGLPRFKEGQGKRSKQNGTLVFKGNGISVRPPKQDIIKGTIGFKNLYRAG